MWFFLFAYLFTIAVIVSVLSEKFPVIDEFVNYSLGFYEDDDDIYPDDSQDTEEDIDYKQKQEEKSLSPENKTLDGYEKDGFVVDDDEDSDPDYIPSDCESDNDDTSTDED